MQGQDMLGSGERFDLTDIGLFSQCLNSIFLPGTGHEAPHE